MHSMVGPREVERRADLKRVPSEARKSYRCEEKPASFIVFSESGGRHTKDSRGWSLDTRGNDGEAWTILLGFCSKGGRSNGCF